MYQNASCNFKHNLPCRNSRIKKLGTDITVGIHDSRLKDNESRTLFLKCAGCAKKLILWYSLGVFKKFCLPRPQGSFLQVGTITKYVEQIYITSLRGWIVEVREWFFKEALELRGNFYLGLKLSLSLPFRNSNWEFFDTDTYRCTDW